MTFKHGSYGSLNSGRAVGQLDAADHSVRCRKSNGLEAAGISEVAAKAKALMCIRDHQPKERIARSTLVQSISTVAHNVRLMRSQ